jgi:hypothetical protein
MQPNNSKANHTKTKLSYTQGNQPQKSYHKIIFLCAQKQGKGGIHTITPFGMAGLVFGLLIHSLFGPAVRTSIHMSAEPPLWHDETITQSKHRELLLQKVFPDSKAKWPRGEWCRSSSNTIILVQQGTRWYTFA